MLVYVVIVLVSLAIFAMVFQPLLDARRRFAPPPRNTINDLRARRRYLLEALRDVELDYSTGKADASEYEETRRSYLREAAQVQRELDQLNDQLDSDIDREIAELREVARQQGLNSEQASESS